jgi:lysophospholipase L1-like esterase
VEAPDAHRSLLRRFDHLGLQRGRRITVSWKARWPGVLASTPGNGFRVVEEGLSARTTMSDPPFLDGRSAKAVYPIVLETHSPVDAVLIMLGTNDLQPVLRLTVEEIGWGCAGLLRTTALSRFGPGGAPPRTLLITPPPLGVLKGAMASAFVGREADSRRMHEVYRPVAAMFGAAFEAGAGQLALGQALEAPVRALFG